MQNEYTSVLHHEFSNYLALRVSLGSTSTHKNIKYILAELDRFLIEIEAVEKIITEDIIVNPTLRPCR